MPSTQFIIGALAMLAALVVTRQVHARVAARRDLVHSFRHRTSAVPIICGDCSGDAISPVKTFLAPDGATCDTCGGSSYTLAAYRQVARRPAEIIRWPVAASGD